MRLTILIIALIFSNLSYGQDVVAGYMEGKKMVLKLDERKVAGILLSNSYEEKVYNQRAKIMKTEDGQYALVAYGYNKEKNSRSAGFYLQLEDNKFIISARKAGGEIHTCKGVNCSECSYFIGCDCNRAGDETRKSHCDHTVVYTKATFKQIGYAFGR
ncbi:MAG: hypothetical protein MRZ79_04970 [Bacteroidia bacterium]|nr:hypothetical protein [Bacteroidia bacterium]